MARLVRIAGLAFAFVVTGWPRMADTVEFRLRSREMILWRLSLAESQNAKRRDVLADLFAQAGCSAVETQKVRGSKLPNIVCTLPGDSPEKVIVAAHYDCLEVSDAVAANWSGAALLASLYEDLRSGKREYTFVFAGVAGTAGASELAARVTAGGAARVRAFIDLDTLGLAPTGVRADFSDQRLTDIFSTVAYHMNARIYRDVVKGDRPEHSQPFRERGVPVLAIRALSPDLNLVPGSAVDSLDLIQRDEYYETYSLVSGFLVMLDREGSRP